MTGDRALNGEVKLLSPSKWKKQTAEMQWEQQKWCKHVAAMGGIVVFHFLLSFYAMIEKLTENGYIYIIVLED